MTSLLTEREKERIEKKAFVQRRKAIIKAEGRPWNLPEWTFTLAFYGVICLVLLCLLADVLTTFSSSYSAKDISVVLSMPFEANPILYSFLLILSILFLALLFLDLASYQPRLFVLASFTQPSEELFTQLGELSIALRQFLEEMMATPTKNYKNLKQMEERIILEANHTCVLDDLRRRITLRTIGRLFSVVLALSLCAYSLTALTQGHFLQGINSSNVGILRHIYFTVVVFFTMGFGDITPYPSPLGYLFIALCALLLILITYFIFSNLLSSYFEFQVNLRQAAHNLVVTYSELDL